MAVIRKRVERHVDAVVRLQILAARLVADERHALRVDAQRLRARLEPLARRARRREQQQARVRHGGQHAAPQEQRVVADLGRIVQAAEGERRAARRWQRVDFESGDLRVVAPERIGQAQRAFAVERVAAGLADGVEPRVGEPVVHRRAAGRARIREPRDLHRRGPPREQQAPPGGHVHREVDKDVDAVLADLPRERGVVERVHVAPDIDETFEALRQGVGLRDARIADDLERRAVVMREQRRREKRLAMRTKIGRDIADAQAPPGRAIVGVRRLRVRRFEQRRLVARRETPAFVEQRLRVVGLEGEREDQVAMRDDGVAVAVAGVAVVVAVACGVLRCRERHRPLVRSHRFVEPPHLQQHVAERRVPGRVGGIQLDRAMQRGFGLAQPLALQHEAEVMPREPVVGLQRNGAAQRFGGLVGMRDADQRAEVVVRVREAGVERDGLACRRFGLLGLCLREQVREIDPGDGEIRLDRHRAPQGLRRFAGAALAEQVAEVEVRRRQRGVQLDRAAQRGFGFAGARPGKQLPETVPRGREVRVEFERAAQRGLGGCGEVRLHRREQRAEVEMRVHEVGAQRDRLLERRACFLGLRRAQQIAEVVVRFRERRIEADGRAQMGVGLRGIVGAEGVGQVEVRGGQRGIERERPAQRGARVVDAALGAQGMGEIDEALRILVRRERLAQQRFGLGRAALLVGDQSAQMQRLCVARRLREQGAAVLLGHGQLPGAPGGEGVVVE
ncbi:hypothetical protein PSAC2689_50035 [Paraburkholderia sacchari]